MSGETQMSGGIILMNSLCDEQMRANSKWLVLASRGFAMMSKCRSVIFILNILRKNVGEVNYTRMIRII